MNRPAESLEARLATLSDLDRKALVGQFRVLFEQDPPLRISNHLLTLAVGYRLQERALGGLKPPVRRSLLTGVASDSPVTSPGTVLIREWHGRKHAVTIFGDRVEYLGNRYRSLTEVALRITGQKRSGPAFFGLRQSGHG
jgi:hypothetical protein